MKYAYYPGCSLLESEQEYNISTRAIMERMGVELAEIPDWTCCGASAAEPVSKLMNYALPARNLALSERDLPGLDVLVPCSACYLNLLKVNREVITDHELHTRVNDVLGASGLSYKGTVTVRHILDILINDIGMDKIRERVGTSLRGMRVAPYYGCQILRPYPVFDDPQRPVSMEGILKALGAEIFSWDKGNRCCGASLAVTHPDVGLHSVAAILEAGEEADVIATVCPMCQMNLEAYQHNPSVNGHRVPVLYLTQLIALAFDMEEESVLLKKNMCLNRKIRTRIRDRNWDHELETAERET
jgi:heterodisulfide reductase subunit B